MSSVGRIYFIQAGDDGPIKLGFARNPRRRLSELQTAHHRRLRLVAMAVGDRADEAWLHRHMQRDRIAGEWFTPSLRFMAMLMEFNGYPRLIELGLENGRPVFRPKGIDYRDPPGYLRASPFSTEKRA